MDEEDIIYDYQYEELLDSILEWSKTINGEMFDPTTFEGIKDNYEEHSNFTWKQKKAIKNVYFKWKIDKWSNNNRNLLCLPIRQAPEPDEGLSKSKGCSECAPYGGNGEIYACDDCYIPCFWCSDIYD